MVHKLRDEWSKGSKASSTGHNDPSRQPTKTSIDVDASGGEDSWPDVGSAVKDPVTPHRKRDPAIVDTEEQDDDPAKPVKRALADELAAAQDAEPVKGPKLRRGKALKRPEADDQAAQSDTQEPKDKAKAEETPKATQPRVADSDPRSQSQPGHSGDESCSGWYDWGGQSDYVGRGWGYWYGQPYGNYWDQWSYGKAWVDHTKGGWSSVLRRPSTSDLFDCPETPQTRTPPKTNGTTKEKESADKTNERAPETPTKEGESDEVTEKSGTIRRGVKKWMTRAEMEKKWDKDITDAIIAYKNSSRSIYEEEVRAHPDAPESEVAMQYWVLDPEATKERREDWMSKLLSMDDATAKPRVSGSCLSEEDDKVVKKAQKVLDQASKKIQELSSLSKKSPQLSEMGEKFRDAFLEDAKTKLSTITKSRRKLQDAVDATKVDSMPELTEATSDVIQGVDRFLLPAKQANPKAKESISNDGHHFIITELGGDWKYQRECFSMRSHWNSPKCCHLCSTPRDQITDLADDLPFRDMEDFMNEILPSGGNWPPLILLEQFHPSKITWCLLHVLYLGLLWTANGASLTKLLELGWFGEPGMDLRLKLLAAHARFRSWLKNYKLQSSQRPFTVGMLFKASHGAYLAAKGFNSRLMAAWLAAETQEQLSTLGDAADDELVLQASTMTQDRRDEIYQSGMDFLRGLNQRFLHGAMDEDAMGYLKSSLLVCHASSLCFSPDGSKIVAGFPLYLRALWLASDYHI
ncbi:hypothetical protein AK812_SmicGene2205 [Symbiodinium microadriaticum]|uniref:Uncharacterized protein n=1 Tax=Symbiodinium microadriaticum TaxID=2951 RepID=A0A1Q9F222_SYMMI|nr:hypothetical protein AK812_SmicGene2205 [Symbiodinium microadriaticum]